MHYTKVQVMVPVSIPKLSGHTSISGELTVDTDEQSVELRCHSMEATFALMDLIKSGEVKIKIEGKS